MDIEIECTECGGRAYLTKVDYWDYTGDVGVCYDKEVLVIKCRECESEIPVGGTCWDSEWDNIPY